MASNAEIMLNLLGDYKDQFEIVPNCAETLLAYLPTIRGEIKLVDDDTQSLFIFDNREVTFFGHYDTDWAKYYKNKFGGDLNDEDVYDQNDASWSIGFSLGDPNLAENMQTFFGELAKYGTE